MPSLETEGGKDMVCLRDARIVGAMGGGRIAPKGHRCGKVVRKILREAELHHGISH